MDLGVFVCAHTSLIFNGILLGCRALNLIGSTYSTIFFITNFKLAHKNLDLGPLCLCKRESKVLARAVLCKDFLLYRP